jgi:hypothetical protein
MSEAVVEAVVISGPRRGEIVRVDLQTQEAWEEEDLERLSDALRVLDQALVGLLDRSANLNNTLQRIVDRY